MPRKLHRQRTPTPEPPSPTIPRPPHLPSDTWPTSHPEYSPAIHHLSCSINYLALRNKCTSLRRGTRCIISPKYYVGANNLVREIVFADKVVWIALFARPDSDGAFAGQARLMQRLRPHIPAVPEVFAYNDQEDELGGRYLLMEGICGIKAEAEYFIFGIPDRYWYHVLEQLGDIMALGMTVTWDTFQVNGETYRSDTAFWIDSARQRIRGALNEICLHNELYDNFEYGNFFNKSSSSLKILFSELLYLNCGFLVPSKRPSNMLMKFPAHLPLLRRENIIFDEEYTIKGLIGFPRTESVSSWEYFQFPYRLEESFDDTSMARTITWMRECFERAWARKLTSLGVSWDGLLRENWSQKDKVQLLLDFRMSGNPEAFMDKLFSNFYSLGSDITVQSLEAAFVFMVFSTLYGVSNAWLGKPDIFIERFMQILALPTDKILQLQELGISLWNGKLDNAYTSPLLFR